MNVYIVLIVQMLVASGTYLVAKSIAIDVEPFALTILRNAVASLALLIIFFVRVRKITIERSDRLRFFLLGFFAIWMNQFMFLFGMRYSTPANAALLYATTPIFVMIISFWSKRETPTAKKIVGVCLAFVGITAVIFERGIDFGLSHTFGNLILLVSVLGWTFYTVLGRPLILKYGSLPVTILSLFAGVLLFLPAGVASLAAFDFSRLTTAHVYELLYLGIGASVVSYTLWYYALSRIEATKVAIFANGQPIVTTILSVFFLQQSVTLAFIIGGAVTIAGVLLTQRSA